MAWTQAVRCHRVQNRTAAPEIAVHTKGKFCIRVSELNAEAGEMHCLVQREAGPGCCLQGSRVQPRGSARPRCTCSQAVTSRTQDAVVRGPSPSPRTIYADRIRICAAKLTGEIRVQVMQGTLSCQAVLRDQPELVPLVTSHC
jgi:hypothetical protein